jgi:serine/threonine protein phosphatase PrpC
VDLFEEELRDEDVVVLCSDGLYRVVEEAEIVRALVAEPQAAAESLVALANQRGAPDNVSVIIVRVALEPSETDAVDDDTLPGTQPVPADAGDSTLIHPRPS